MPRFGLPPTVQPTMAYAASPAGVGDYPPASVPLQQVYPQSAAMPANGMCIPGAIGTSPGQAGESELILGFTIHRLNPLILGAINLIVNANSNPNGGHVPDRVNALASRPAPRPCPKCRMGYITRGQARFREVMLFLTSQKFDVVEVSSIMLQWISFRKKKLSCG